MKTLKPRKLVAGPGYCVCPRPDSGVPHIKTEGCPWPMKDLREQAERHLLSLTVDFLENGGRPDLLVRSPFRRQYRLLLQALELLDHHEAAGRVRTWVRKNEKKLSDLDR